MLKVGEIADITAGYHFRGAITGDSVLNATPILQLRDIPDEGGLVSLGGVARTMSAPGVNVEKGKILLQAKASAAGRFRAAYYDIDEPAVASSVLFVITVKSPNVLPEFLSFYLNTPEAQRYMQASSQTHTVRTLRRDDIEEMVISLPSLEDQRGIVDFYKSLLKSESLVRERGVLIREILYKQISQKIYG